MQWLPSLPPAASVTPISSATGDAASYLLSFGPLGIGVVLFGLVRGRS